jgi:hypothetical protein
MYNFLFYTFIFLILEWSFLVMHSNMLPFFFVVIFLIIIFFLSNKYMELVISFFLDSFEVLVTKNTLRYLFNWQLFFFLKLLLITIIGFFLLWNRILVAIKSFFVGDLFSENLLINNFSYLYTTFFKFIV